MDNTFDFFSNASPPPLSFFFLIYIRARAQSIEQYRSAGG